ncbi:MAG: radical SAM protein [Bacteroidales bacterium]|nr:radical SAM protein [Bacteroidales bacterium]
MIAFGPIPSRRLGKSLGINNIASHKICSYSCVYCQIGITRNKSITRMAFYEPDFLFSEVEKHLLKLGDGNAPDYLTFVTNGEPTLDINLGKEIRMLKRLGLPVAVITNSSLLYDPRVREELTEADWVSVKVDAVDKELWKKINQPLSSSDFEEMLRGLEMFSSSYTGSLHTETMLLKGYNDSIPPLKQTASWIATLNPEMAYLSVPTRPPALKEVKPAASAFLAKAWNIFRDLGIQTELLTGFEGTGTGITGNAYEDILNITAVHPLREDTMKELLRKNKADENVVHALIKQGLIKATHYKGKTYYIRSYHCK